jgi:phosphoribosylformimino-5-aminoimidazole carboxamide ribotide isomerase
VASSPTTSFELLPAIDLRGGRVVRLRQGDFARETAYADDPAAVARTFAAAGARWLHVVDLDGARAGSPAHEAEIAAIVAAVGSAVGVEVAGGLRTRAGVGASSAASSRSTVFAPAPRLSRRAVLAWSTSICRIAFAATARKCARFSKLGSCWSARRR